MTELATTNFNFVERCYIDEWNEVHFIYLKTAEGYMNIVQLCLVLTIFNIILYLPIIVSRLQVA